MTNKDAMNSLRDPVAVASKKHLNAKIKVSNVSCHPLLIEFHKKFQKQLDDYGIPFRPFEFHRTAWRQNELFDQGRSKARAWESPHQWGMAVDMIHTFKAWDLSRAEWSVIGEIGKQVAERADIFIEWGGDWNFYDPAHWQLADWHQYRANIVLMYDHHTDRVNWSHVQRVVDPRKLKRPIYNKAFTKADWNLHHGGEPTHHVPERLNRRYWDRVGYLPPAHERAAR